MEKYSDWDNKKHDEKNSPDEQVLIKDQEGRICCWE